MSAVAEQVRTAKAGANAEAAAPLREKAEDQVARVLVESGDLAPQKVESARRLADSSGESLMAVLETESGLERSRLLAALEEVYGLPVVDFEEALGDPLILPLVPRDLAFEVGAVPLYLVEGRLTVAMIRPEDLANIDRLRFASGKEIRPVAALPGQLRRHLAQAYGAGDLDLLEPLQFEGGRHATSRFSSFATEQPDDAMGESVESQAGRLIHLVLSRAVHEGASAVHFEPREQNLFVRLRIDGSMLDLPYDLPRELSSAVVARLKRLAGIDARQRDTPQHGAFRLRYQGSLRCGELSTLPTPCGERAVLRVESGAARAMSFPELGMASGLEERWKELLGRSEGLIVVTGPSGSLRSSTLDASVRHLAATGACVVQARLGQPDAREAAAVGAVASAESAHRDAPQWSVEEDLRSLLRQDPDAIVVPDLDTEEAVGLALRAALTGQLVLAKMRAEDPLAAVLRLIDLGASRAVLAGVLQGVLAQRRVRRCCTACRDDGAVDHDLVQRVPLLGESGLVPQREGACIDCSGRGFRGTLALHQLMEADSAVRSALAAGEFSRMVEVAHDAGMTDLWCDGVTKVQQRETTMRELLRWVGLRPVPPAQLSQDDGAAIAADLASRRTHDDAGSEPAAGAEPVGPSAAPGCQALAEGGRDEAVS